MLRHRGFHVTYMKPPCASMSKATFYMVAQPTWILAWVLDAAPPVSAHARAVPCVWRLAVARAEVRERPIVKIRSLLYIFWRRATRTIYDIGHLRSRMFNNDLSSRCENIKRRDMGEIKAAQLLLGGEGASSPPHALSVELGAPRQRILTPARKVRVAVEVDHFKRSSPRRPLQLGQLNHHEQVV